MWSIAMSDYAAVCKCVQAYKQAHLAGDEKLRVLESTTPSHVSQGPDVA